MKSYKIALLFGVILIVLLTESCKKTFFSGVNNNPNVVSNVAPNLLLPSVEIALGFTQGGDFARNSSLLTQQTTGNQQQSKTFYLYGINAGTFENQWADLYTSTMENDYALKSIADKSNDNVYSGVSRILMAYCLQLAVDNWGSVPYSQAFKGNTDGILQPAYDSDRVLYDSIAQLVDIGIAQLNSSNPGISVPSTDDVIYGGDVIKWSRFGHAIKARLYIHQSKNNAAMATAALAQIDSSFADATGNAEYLFAGDPGLTQNPMFQFCKDRGGYITFSNSTMAAQMYALNDPRGVILFDSTNDASGNLSVSGTHYGGLNDFYGSASSPVEFISYDELLFISAEATLRATGNIPLAQSQYQAAITANMTKLGVAPGDITTYLAANGTLPAPVDSAIAHVAAQEYFALYLNPEAFTLYRRTSSPALTPPPTAPGSVPRRYIYPQSEYSYNAANTPASTLYTPRIFWDN